MLIPNNELIIATDFPFIKQSLSMIIFNYKNTSLSNITELETTNTSESAYFLKHD